MIAYFLCMIIYTYIHTHMDVSKNRGTPKSSSLIGFFLIKLINHLFWGTPIFWKHPYIYIYIYIPIIILYSWHLFKGTFLKLPNLRTTADAKRQDLEQQLEKAGNLREGRVVDDCSFAWLKSQDWIWTNWDFLMGWIMVHFSRKDVFFGQFVWQRWSCVVFKQLGDWPNKS